MRWPSDANYAYLLELRTGLRRFLHWSEQQAKAAGLTATQHQLLLAIRGHRGPEAPAIGEIAGLVQRSADPDQHRVVRLALTPEGAH